MTPNAPLPQADASACAWPVPAQRLRRARITPLDSQFRHCIHCYHGVDAFDRAGKRLVYAGFDDPDDVAIVVRELDTGEEHILARTSNANYHTAVGQRWALDDTAVLFQHQLDDGRTCPTLVYVDRPGEVQPIEAFVGRSVRHVIDHGHLATAYTPIGEIDRLPGRVELLDLRQQTAATLVPMDRVVERLQATRPDLHDDDAEYFLNHPVPNQDQSIYFFKLMKRVDDHSGFVSFFIYDADDDEVRCFGNRISGHPYWMSDGLHILNIKNPNDGSNNRHLVLVNAKTGADHRLCDLPTEGPGHPSQSPTGGFAVTDAFTADGHAAPIYLFDLDHNQALEIARLEHEFQGGRYAHQPGHITRGQPHPIWSPCGTKILVNCNQAGEHYRLHLLDEFLVEA